MRWAMILALAVVLGSCDSMSAKLSREDSRRLDIAEVNIRNGALASSAMVDRVERAERRIEELERKMRDREEMERAIIANFRAHAH